MNTKFLCSFTALFLLFTVTQITAPELLSAQSGKIQQQIDTNFFQDLEFRTVGPTRGGRVTAVEGHRAHPHTFYMGAAGGGGVWKTTDYGDSWVNITDGQGFKSTSIGAIQVADSDTSIIYVGTGTDGIRSNVTTGKGVYKSTDAGKSWNFIGLEEAGQVGSIEVHPGNPDLVYVAALGHAFGPNPERGVFRSKDGGEHWEKVLFASDTTGAIDLEMHPENPDVIYAALWRGERKPWTIISGADKENGIYKTTDGGDTWQKIEKGLPKGLIGKIDFAVTPADPDRVYALVEAPDEEEGLYRSDDRGESWTHVSNHSGIMTRPFYFTNITANPKQPDVIYVGNVGYYVSTDAGKNFDRRRVTHSDVHDLWINPENPRIQVQGNDGGATVTLDGGQTWSTQLNQPTAELYQVNVDTRIPYWLYAGQQDNSTIAVPSLPPAESAENPQGLWHMIGGCETGPAVPQPNNPSIIFSNCKGRFGMYSTVTGQEKEYWVGAQYMYGRNPAKLEYRFQRVAPIEISPHDSSVVYHGSQYLHRTKDGGETWETISPDLTAFKPQYQVASGRPITRDITGEEHFSTLYSIQVSPHSDQVIWTGANDGPVYITRNGGESWTDVTPADLPPDGRVDAIEPSPHQPGTAYIAVERRKLDDFHPYIYKTENYGKSWSFLTSGRNGIPADYPTRVVREDPDRQGLLYAGTDYGVFISFNDGKQWQSLDQGLPVTPVTDIRVHNKDLALSTMGRGFWILDNLSPLHQVNKDMATEEHHLYQPRDAYRMRYWGGGGVPEYIDAGAMIDFYLPETAGRHLTVDFYNEDGDLVRRFIGKADTKDEEQKSRVEPERAMMTPEIQYSSIPDTFRIESGHNRFIWNLRYPAERVPGENGQNYFGPRNGTMAAPGTYRVKISTGDWSESTTFRVKMDPRVEAEGITVEDLQAQLDLNLDISRLIGRAEKLSSDMDTLRDRIAKALDNEQIEQEQTDAWNNKIDRLYNQLETSDEGSYPPPMLLDQLGYLYGMTTSADQRPGNDAYSRYETLREEFESLLKEWRELEQEITVPK